MSDKVTWREVAQLVSPAGQEYIINMIRTARERRGADWLAEIEENYPMATWIVGLVCNMEAEQAYSDLQSTFPNYPLWIAKSQIVNLHGRLRAEIERPR